jgi:superfamily II DNA or RNA helicase
LEARGLSVAVFTGDDKSGLRRFTVGKADVLIGSGTLREGVDGLQARCGRIVVASLPWTGAGFEQLVGRVWRQGMVHDHVDLIIPQVVLSTDSEDWSWDQRRHDRVRYKRTLADAAVTA